MSVYYLRQYINFPLVLAKVLGKWFGLGTFYRAETIRGEVVNLSTSPTNNLCQFPQNGRYCLVLEKTEEAESWIGRTGAW